MAKIKKKKDNKNKGFTLIELLAVVAIIALLVGIVIFSVNRLFGSSEEKANEVSEESIKKGAVTYANENYMSANYWMESLGEIEGVVPETFCVPVVELVNKGLLKEQEIIGYENSFVKISRDSNNKTIIDEVFVDDNSCAGYISDQTGAKAWVYANNHTTSSVDMIITCGLENGTEVSALNYSFEAYLGDKKIKTITQDSNIYRFQELKSGEGYVLKGKCNFSGFSSSWSETDVTIGETDVKFQVSGVELDSANSDLVKKVKVDFSSSDFMEAEKYYIKSTTNTKVESEETVFYCGSDKVPGTCSYGTDTLKPGDWYLVSDDVDLIVTDNSIIYAKVWDGLKYSTNKSTQITFPSNPYVTWEIIPFDDPNVDPDIVNISSVSGSAIGASTGDIDFYTSTWINFPKISWNIYGGYDTISTVYYDANNSYSSRGNANKDSGYSCNFDSCELTSLSAEGMQKIKIVVVNTDTKAETEIIINMDIDKIKPAVPSITNPTSGNWTNANFKLKLSGSDAQAGVGYYQYTYSHSATTTGDNSTSQWVTYSDSASTSFETPAFSKERNQDVYIRVCDKAGNCSDKSSTSIKIDKTVPSTPTITNSSGGNWTNQNVVLTIKSSDPASNSVSSGIKQMYYSYNQSNWYSDWDSGYNNASSGTVRGTWSAERDNTVYVKVVDNAGNESTYATSVIRIDKTAPTAPTTMEYVFEDWSRYTRGNWTNKTVYAANTSSSKGPSGSTDTNGSGVVKYQISSDGSTWEDYSYSSSSSMYCFSTTGTHIRYYRAVDNAGNVSSSISRTALIDKTAPVVNMSIKNAAGTTINDAANYQGTKTVSYNSGNWSNSVPTVYFTITDTTSITNNVYYNADGVYTGNPVTATNLHTFNSSDRTAKTGSISINSGGVRQLKFVVTDAAGNVSTISVNAWLDYTIPSKPTSIAISGSSLVFSGASDEQSGIAKYRYSVSGAATLNGNATSLNLSNMSTNGTYYVYTSADDNAGNNSGAINKTLTVASKTTSAWYSCSSGSLSGAYCYHYGTVYTRNYCASGYTYSNGYCYYTTKASSYCSSYCSYNSSTGKWCNWDKWWSSSYCYSTYNNCVTGCGSDCACLSYSYSCSSGSLSGSYCYHYGTVYSEKYCASGYTYSNGYCYYTTSATYNSSSYCASDYIEVNGKCYKLS